ncbi:hypothetical protein HHX48_09680 [Salinimonas sp. HHU 13199]|uniref:Type I restriction modification DNA specificity domain-containing protein n=1 Tax=Salinimonas profundi TaxID=2729140 RepID=A0ABR8LID7_9ALTE|nr:restriction endonuclease subunit S [Salinimonas profundi]MBD3586006.1 hypothetical protein [Salinimonas profundi]
MNWVDTRVGDFSPFVYGKAIAKKDQLSDGVPVFGSNGVYTYSSKPLVGPYAVIIGRKGTVGKIHISEKPCWVSDTAFYIQYDNIEEAYFSYYLLSSLGLEDMNTDAAVPGLNRNNAHRLEVKIPDTIEQRRQLVEPLIKLDNKIHLDQQINQTLEQVAQAIFKSWFVDFEPVKAKIAALAAGGSDEDALLAAMQAISGKDAGQLAIMQADQPEQYAELRANAALFPSAMQESELGEIPSGWSIEKTESLSEKIGMGPFGSNIKVSTFVEDGVPIISGQHLKETLVTDGDNNFITEQHADKLKNSNVYPEDIIFTHAGSIGQVSIIPAKSKWDRYVISQRQFFLRVDREKASPYFLAYFFRSFLGQHLLLSNASQVGVPSIARPSSHLKSIELVTPTVSLQEKFESHVKKLNDLVMANRKESETLKSIRETLLPKLLSGELSVDAEVKSQGKVEYDRAHDLAALIEKIESDLPSKSHFVESERVSSEFENIRAIGFMTKITGSLGEGGGEYLKLPVFLRTLRQNPILDKVLSATVDGVVSIPFFMDAIIAILNKYLGNKIQFDQKTALVLLAFPKETYRKTSELLNKAYQLSINAGLPPIDEDELHQTLSWLHEQGLVLPENKNEAWRLVDKFRHEIDNWD